ncbi:MAG: dTDP-glucose 4,6-dehydratase [Pseudomonadota bacterium]
MRVLMTGGCGFIGTAIADLMLRRGNQVLNIDRLTYAANPSALQGWMGSDRYRIVKGDICDMAKVLSVFEEFQPDCVIHAAAESSVDRSIDGAAQFLQTNFVGTYTMLEAARHWWAKRKGTYRFHHVSTDEVFGSLGPGDPGVREQTSYAPNSPYAASKAASDHLVRAWGQTYGLPVVTTHSTNSYGPWQFPEKLVPLMITKGAEGEALPLYGAGDNVRDWLHVADHAEAVRVVLEHGNTGETYNVGGSFEQPNVEIVRMICNELDEHMPENAPHERMICHVEDRVAHDWRYAVDTTKIWSDLRWRPEIEFRRGLSRTVDWYLQNRPWWQEIRRKRYRGERLGRQAA